MTHQIFDIQHAVKFVIGSISRSVQSCEGRKFLDLIVFGALWKLLRCDITLHLETIDPAVKIGLGLVFFSVRP